MTDKKLNAHDLTDACIWLARQKGMGELAETAHDLHCRIKVFEALTWFPFLQKQVSDCAGRGMRGKVKGVTVLTWVCAGRCLVQLEEGGVSLCLITADDEKPWAREDYHIAPMMGPMGLQSVDGEWSAVVRMLHKATRYGSAIELKSDEKVSIGI